jgi:hypothetical protein
LGIFAREAFGGGKKEKKESLNESHVEFIVAWLHG